MNPTTETNHMRAYREEAYPPMPTRKTLFWRRFVLWQGLRFFVLNLKMMRIVAGGHS